MTLTDLKNKKNNLGTCSDMLHAMGYHKRTTLEVLDGEYDKIDTIILNLDIPQTISDDKILFDDKNYKLIGYIE
jgi:hypothetical protein